MDKKKTKNKNHNKKKYTASNQLAKFRGWIQAGATLLTNIHLPNFFKGEIYQGKGKAVCVPGLNCYSCPAASGACPIGSFQAVVGSSKYKFSYYITGFLILLGVLLGRFICGFLCPFGWLQDLLHKVPTKKFSTKKLKPLTYIKYAVLLLAVVLLPVLIVNDLGMGDPYFCNYIWCVATFGSQRRYPFGIGTTVFVETCCADFGSRFERAVLQTVLQMDLPTRCILCTVQQGFAVWDEGRRAQMRFVR